MPGIENLFASSAPQAQPVVNLPQQMNDLAQQQGLNQMRQAQTAGATQDIYTKQRNLQLSGLGGLGNLTDPAQRAMVINSLNKIGPLQFDPNMDEPTRQAIMMQGVPIEQQPTYALNQGEASLMQTLRNRLGGGQQVQPGGAAPNGTPTPAGQAPAAGGMAANNGLIAGIDPQTLVLAGTSPNLKGFVDSATNVQKTLNEGPGGKAQAEYQTKSAGKLADLDASENLLRTSINQMYTALQPDKDLGGKSPAEIAVGGLAPETRSTLGEQFPQIGGIIGANPTTGLAYNKLQTLLNPEAGEEAKASFNRVTGQEFKTFQSAQGLNVPPAQRPAVIRTAIAQAEKKLADIQAQRAGLVTQAGVNAPQNAASQLPTQMQTPQGGAASQLPEQMKPQTGKPNLVANQTIYKGHLYLGGPPDNPDSWRALNGK